MSAYLGIDIGTYESKGALVGVDGEILASAARAHKMLVPRSGWAEHRADEDWWADFAAISRELIARAGVAPGEVRAVGASGIGPCVLPVDEAGRPLSNSILYGVDTRAAREIEDLEAAIGADVILERCGNALTSQSVGPKILWLKRNRPDVFARAHKFLNSTCYLVHRLTGRFVVDHYTAANASPLYLADSLDWSAALAPDITPLDRLPDLAWTTEIAGGVSARAADETGIAAGTPVIVGTVDAAAEAVSVGVREPGEMMLMYGSTVFTVLITATRLRDPRLWWAPWLFPGRHAALAGLATSGALTHWFRDQFARELDPTAAMSNLANEAASSPPGARGLVFLPYFSGERTPIHDPRAKGAWFGLNLTHSRADMYRALLEGIGCATRHVLETYAEAGASASSIRAVGGGVRNEVWTRATSDISELAQSTLKFNLGACYGDAFLAALAIGDVGADDIRRWNPVERRVEPDAEHASVYRRQYRVFRELYARNRDLMARLEGEASE
jgi:xylulokinase